MKKRATTIGLLAAAAMLLAAGPARGDEVTAIKAATLWTGAGKSIANGVVLVRDGKIAEIGPADSIEIPEDARVVALEDGFVMPGLVVPYSRLGLFGPSARPIGARGSATTQFTNKAGTNPTAELFPRQAVFQELCEVGVTTLGLIPSTGGGITGTVSVIRPRGDDRSAMVIREGVLLRVGFGGGSSASSGLKTLLERAKSEAEKVAKAQKRRDEWEKREAAKRKKAEEKRKKAEEKRKKEGKKPEASDEAPKKKTDESRGPSVPELKPEIAPIVKAREGELRVLLEVPGPAVLDHFFGILKDRHELDTILVASGRTALRLEALLVKKKIPVLLTPTLTTEPPTNVRVNPAARLEAAGVEFAFRPVQDSVSAIREIFYHLGVLVKCGLGQDAALRAVTLTPARWLGVDGEVGSLEKGKSANLLLFSRNPLVTPLAELEGVWLDGHAVLDRKSRED